MRNLIAILILAMAATAMADKTCGASPNANKNVVASTKADKVTCYKANAAKQVVKGGKNSCANKGQMAAFKVFVAGNGYKFFGCQDSAAKGRTTLVAQGKKVGGVQKVSRRAVI